MPTRSARTAWNGGLQDGSGQVELSSSGVGTFDVSFPKRAADDADGTTSPEELVAAAHSSCYAMQFSALIAEAGGTPQALEVTADVTLGPDKEAGGFKLTGITLTVRGEVDGLDEAGFKEAAEKAKGLPDQQGAHRGRDHARRRARGLRPHRWLADRRGPPGRPTTVDPGLVQDFVLPRPTGPAAGRIVGDLAAVNQRWSRARAGLRAASKQRRG